MSAVIVLIIRIVFAIVLLVFIGSALYMLWQQFSFESQNARSKNIPAISLVPINTGEAPYKYADPEVMIGRDQSNELVIEDETVSARHARLSYHHKQWWLEDLQSTNGTFINDERVHLPTVLITGDDLRLGKVIFQIVISLDV
jgi:pSer/pThr/pTyr-binding forkhead associated (FHA) protein